MAGSQTQSLVLLSLHPPSAVQAVVLVPFIDEPRLLRVLGPLLAKLKPHEKAENMVVCRYRKDVMLAATVATD